MGLFKKPSSATTYTILLILASVLLLFIASISYKRILQLQESGDMISHTLQVEGKINELFSYYPMMEAAEFRAFLMADTTNLFSSNNYKEQGKVTMHQLYGLIDDNPKQKTYLDSVSRLQEKLYSSLTALDSAFLAMPELKNVSRRPMAEVSKIMAQMADFRNKMLGEERRLIKERKEIYDINIKRAPLFLLLLSLFALFIFGFSFRRVYQNRMKIQRTEAFLQNILRNSNNIISFVTPIYDSNDTIVDFNLEFTNQNIEEIEGGTAPEVIGKPLSKTYPFIYENGVFEIMKRSMETQQTIYNEEDYELENGHFYYYTTYAPSERGLHITSANITTLKNADLLVQQANKELEALNVKLTMQNTVLEDAEVVTGIGSFKWDLENDVSEISNNFYRLIEYEPEDFEPSMEGFRKLVHPEDLPLYDKKGKQALRERKMTQFTYRAITKSGKIKYLKTFGHFVEQNNKQYMLGVAQDVTQQITYEQRLKNKNQELKASNEELKSFNRVASHDLQEPLRKIQMFISRISENEENNLSERGQAYFDKIDDAATRMRSLIKYLLAYSRISKKVKKVADVDLNVILEGVIDDFNERIKESKAQIKHDMLPIVKAVPFQMEQLFSNLISNALKYKSETDRPRIAITSQTLKKKEITEKFTKTAKQYHRIAIQDNGIGFDTKKKQKIFEVFQRLHAKDEYSGTGIGLAICKKIVAQHGGFISASSTPNEGSVFYFYLPA
ncbi:ATP-binding protein [Allomuricauda sp. d1]|uniref:ATP-binding protein n=1 Tax=Allomuricauda sp. d1 TaxID=3136725 RepID=UPI0031D94259